MWFLNELIYTHWFVSWGLNAANSEIRCEILGSFARGFARISFKQHWPVLLFLISFQNLKYCERDLHTSQQVSEHTRYSLSSKDSHRNVMFYRLFCHRILVHLRNLKDLCFTQAFKLHFNISLVYERWKLRKRLLIPLFSLRLVVLSLNLLKKV